MNKKEPWPGLMALYYPPPPWYEKFYVQALIFLCGILLGVAIGLTAA